MGMYMTGFTTLMGAEDYWKVEFSIGAWKPVKNSIKRQLGIPVLDEPLWVVGLPPTPEDGILEDPHPFRTLVSRLDIVSFNQMVRLAARDDVEVNFPNGADPRVIEVYIRMKTAMYQVADGLSLEDWREFNRRLLHMLQELEPEYRPEALPVPDWWQPGLASSSKPGFPGSDTSGDPRGPMSSRRRMRAPRNRPRAPTAGTPSRRFWKNCLARKTPITGTSDPRSPDPTPLDAERRARLERFQAAYAAPQAPPWDSNIVPPEVRALVEDTSPWPPGRALDVGCGSGTSAVYLAAHGWQVTGVDWIAAALDQARQRATSPRSRSRHGPLRAGGRQQAGLPARSSPGRFVAGRGVSAWPAARCAADLRRARGPAATARWATATLLLGALRTRWRHRWAGPG